MNRNIIILGIRVILIITLSIACSKNPTENKMSPQELISEGWKSFEAGNYETAVDRFEEALAQDNTLWEAHHGLGWSHARLGNSGQAVNHFLNAISLYPVSLSVKAGLAFIYNAQMQYNNSNQQAEEVLQLNAQWIFEHDSRIDWKDLVILKAENYFALGQFENSLQEIKKLNPDFNTEVVTTSGQAKLAAEIERLLILYS